MIQKILFILMIVLIFVGCDSDNDNISRERLYNEGIKYGHAKAVSEFSDEMQKEITRKFEDEISSILLNRIREVFGGFQYMNPIRNG